MQAARVLVIGAWDTGPGYPRARALIASLRLQGIQVREENCPLVASGLLRRGLLKSPWRWPAWFLATLRQKRELRARFHTALAEFRPDVVLVPYPGHLLIRSLRAIYQGPLVLDLFLSAYGTVIEDRRMFRAGSLPARVMDHLDRRACAVADLVLMDTQAQADWLRSRYHLKPDRVTWVPVADPDEAELAPQIMTAGQTGLLRLLFFGTDIPLHGLDVLIEAVAATPRIALTLIGGSDLDRQRAGSLLGDRLELLPTFVDARELRKRIAAAELVAGIFGRSTKASMVLPFKVMHALSLGRPVVTVDSAATRQFLRPGFDCAVCPANDPRALAAVLNQLAAQRDRLAAMGEAARITYQDQFSLTAIGKQLCDGLESVTGKPLRSLPAQAPRSHAAELLT